MNKSISFPSNIKGNQKINQTQGIMSIFNKCLEYRRILVSFFFIIQFNALFGLTVRTWDGGAGNGDFNNATNWSDNILPSSSDSVVIILTADKTITLSGNITIGALYLYANGANVNLYFDCVSYLLTIDGNLHAKSTGNSNTDLYIDLGSSSGGMTVGRHTFIDDGGSQVCYVKSDITSPGIFKLRGNLTIGSYGRTIADYEPDIVLDAASSQTVTSNNTVTYFLSENLTIGSTNNPTVTLAGATSNGFGCYNGSVTINGTSTLNIASNTIDRLGGAGGSFTMASGSTLKIGGTDDFPASYSTYSLNAASNVYYNGTTQTITNISSGYGNLYIDGSSTKTFASSTMDINGSLTITAGTLATGSNNATVAGNWTNNATFTAGTSTITFDGNGTQTVSGSSTTTFYNVTTANSSVTTFSVDANISNDLTLGGTSTVDANAVLDINGNVTIAAGTSFKEGSNTHTVAGSWTDNGTFTEEGGTINFDGSGSQTISGSSVNFNNFTHSGSGTASLITNVDINGNVNLTAGVLDQSNNNIYVAGNWTSTGNYFLEGTGTVTFDGSGNSTISSTTASYVTSTDTLMSESFENGGSIPSGWAEQIVTDAGTNPDLLFVSSSTHPSSVFSATAGTYFVRFNSYDAHAPGQSRLKQSSSFSTNDYNNIVVNFDWTQDNEYSGANDYINVQYSTDGSTWTTAGSTIYRYSASGDSWTAQSVSLPTAAENQPTLYIAFLFTSAYGNDCHLDNVIVTGDSSTTITGEIFNNFAITKSGGAYVQQSSDVWLPTSLTLTTGVIKTGDYTLILGTDGTNATVSGGSSSSYIVAYDNAGTIGEVKQYLNYVAAYSFPIGDATNYTPLTFTLASGTLSSAYLTIYTKAVKVPGLGSEVTEYIDRHWSVTQNGITSPSYDISYTYVNGDIVGVESSMLPIKKSGSTWYKPVGSSFTNGTAEGTGSVNTATNTLTWTGLSTFSFFGGAGDASVLLPIELLHFDADKGSKVVLIDWSTASEINNDFFTLERSKDGVNFTAFATVNGAGNSSVQLNYHFDDREFFPGINYYRLIQTDFDGQQSYSNVVAVDMGGSDKIFIMTVNSIGQEVNGNYRGLVFDIFSDGSSVKRFQ